LEKRGGAVPSGNRTKLDFRGGVALTIHYLADQSGFKTIANLFGISKSGAVTRVNGVLDLLLSVAPDIIRVPNTRDQWYFL
jgi:hypothetical protein